MINAKTSFRNEEEMRAYINEAETLYNDQLSLAAEYILSQREHRIVTLSGPSCSGKTTTGKKLIERLSRMGQRVHLVSLDDFFLPRDLLLARAADNGGKIDFDSPNTLDYASLSSVIADIRANRAVTLPKFSFLTGKREGEETVIPQENDLFLFEGIQAVYPEVTSLLKNREGVSVFARVNRSIALGERVFEPNEIRLFRRLVRDYHFRGASASFTLDLWQSVRENEEKHIFPNALECDIYIDSTLSYEIMALYPLLKTVLLSLPPESPHNGMAKKIIAALDKYEPIKKGLIPQDSVSREFLG